MTDNSEPSTFLTSRFRPSTVDDPDSSSVDDQLRSVNGGPSTSALSKFGLSIIDDPNLSSADGQRWTISS